MNLIYIESPFHLLQAYEIICQKRNTSFKLLIRTCGNNVNNDQLYKLVHILDLDDLVTFVRDRRKLMIIFIAFRIVIGYFKSKYLYIGDERSRVFKIIRLLLKKNKVILLDDGSATLNTRLSSVYKRFTIFSTKCFTKNNDFCNIKKLISSHNVTIEKSIIIGQTIADTHWSICSPAVYEEYLERLMVKCNNDAIYIPHRWECDKNIEIYREKFGFDVIRLSLPIELIQLELGIKPKRVYGCISTAFFSLDMIYHGISFECYRFKDHDLKKSASEINVFYKYLDNMPNLKIIDL